MKRLIIFIIKIYQLLISRLTPNKCRFYPSCSNYSIEAIEKYGAMKGTYLSVLRILKCNPFSTGGYDPLA